MKRSKRLDRVPPYLFAEIDKLKAKAIAAGKDVISFGIGDPDLPTPGPVIDTLKKEAENPPNHQYPSYEGMLVFRQAVADWYQRRFGVDLDPKNEVLTLIGSKEGIAHINLGLFDPGDTVLVPDPGYPVYEVGAILAGAEPVRFNLSFENDYRPDFSVIPTDVAKQASAIWLNYPNNPTSSIVPVEAYDEAVAFCKEHDLILLHDAAYTEVYFDDAVKPASVLQAKGAKDVAIEFHSLSKTANMTGWRIGMACGNAEVLEALGTIKTNVDSGAFNAVQYAGITALNLGDDVLGDLRATYKKRRDALVSGLRELGFTFHEPKATFYVWVKNPPGIGSADFAKKMLEECALIVTPGTGYGKNGEGFFRMTFTLSHERIREGLERMKAAGIRGN